jgi:Na+-transporting NADH:ubiquinone oxidoreductase subunit C
MTESRIRQHVFTVFFMFIVTFVAITLVAMVQAATERRVMQNKTVFLKMAVCDATGLQPPDDIDALLKWYDEHVTPLDEVDGYPLRYRVKAGAGLEKDTLVLVERGPGLWGEITALVGFYAEKPTIKAVTFLAHVETPGLGARIDEPWFKAQFVGKTGPLKKLLPEPKDKSDLSNAPDKFDQITGATITSTAVKDIINASIERAKAEIESPQNAE